MLDSNDIMEYRTNSAETDWEDSIKLCTTSESCGFFGMFKRSVVDKEMLYKLLCEKHFYWEGDFGYFRDHWNYWFVTYPAMKNNPYFNMLPFPCQHLMTGGSNAVKVYEKYWYGGGDK